MCAAVVLVSVPGMQAAALDDPEGLWSCVVFGSASRPDERVALILTPASTAYLASLYIDAAAWRQVGDWSEGRRRVTFTDARLGRDYTADLRHPTLGGTWGSRSESGGWWCARRPEDPVGISLNRRGAAPEFLTGRLVPDSMASPRYPLRAIREAREGAAVACFLVDPSGRIVDPRIVVSTDEIFEATTLSAVNRSRYRPAPEGTAVRPGCRQYTYTLDMIDR